MSVRCGWAGEWCAGYLEEAPVVERVDGLRPDIHELKQRVHRLLTAHTLVCAPVVGPVVLGALQRILLVERLDKCLRGRGHATRGALRGNGEGAEAPKSFL